MKTEIETMASLYAEAFPAFQPLQVVSAKDGTQRLEGLWIMGNDYSTKTKYYGAYPAGYLRRVLAMFPGQKKILHVPSGSIQKGDYTRVDIRPECDPDIVWDCHDLQALFPAPVFDLVMADIPYSVEDSEHYGTPMVKRNLVLKSCLDVLVPGGWIIWLDQAFPQFSKEKCKLALAVGMIKSTNHRVRAVFGFKKKEQS